MERTWQARRAVDVDVVVAGAGAAGLSAALSAAEHGRSVALLEASPTFRKGNSTSMSAGMVPAAGSRWQEEAGISDSPAVFREDIERKTGGQADPELTEALTSTAPELVAWLADHCGVPLSLVTDFNYPGHTNHRCHALPDRSGATLQDYLVRAVDREPQISFVTPCKLVDIQLTPEGPFLAKTAMPDGQEDVIASEAVVLATSGFAGDPALVARHLGEIASAQYHGGDGSNGDALKFGMSIGADTGYLDAYQGHGSLSVVGVPISWMTVMLGAYLVNQDGERYGDETIGYSEYGLLTTRQPGAVGWMVFDARIDAAAMASADYRHIREAGAVSWADDVDQLAGTLGADPVVLERTVREAEAAARGLDTDRHGRRSWGSPLESPYAAVKVEGALFHTQGGLRVNRRAQVLKDGQPIPGLFAAGGAAIGVSGHGASGYLAGNGLLAALGLGYLAGRTIGR